MALTTRARFAGLWSVARDIDDRLGGQQGRFRGLARITPAPDGLRYAEQGLLVIGQARTQASRVYQWRDAGPRRIDVRYEDGAPFHVIDWSGVEWRDAHRCGQDDYAVRYSFAASSWHAHWRVTGPRKEYTSSTRYLRAAPQDAQLADEAAGA
jgi:hypothetical protein